MARSGLLLLALLFAAVSCILADPCQTWYDVTQHGPNFRNVRTYGAKGDGVTDDTGAFLAALTAGRVSTPFTTAAFVVYVPAGNYIISQTLPLYFYTQLVGNSACLPTITLASNAFGAQRKYFIDADTDDNSGHTNQFYRGLMHLRIVIAPGNAGAIAVHWAVSQATFIRDVVIEVGDGSTGIFMENGSGGFISDLIVTGGDVGITTGNQQWTWRNITVSGSRTAGISLLWDWAYVFMGLNIFNVPVAIIFQVPQAGMLVLIDSTFTDVSQVAILTAYPQLVAGVYLQNVSVTRTPLITAGFAGTAAGPLLVPAWRQGLALDASGAPMPGTQSALPPPASAVGGAPLPSRPRPTFADAAGGTVYNAYTAGARGDGVTDDTAALQAAIDASPSGVVFLPQGVYRVSAPLRLRANTALVGEGPSTLLAAAGSSAWSDAANPQPMLLLPPGQDSAPMLIDLLFETQPESSASLPGCLLVDWQSGPATGTWDVHWRITAPVWGLLQISGDDAGGYAENSWAWVADHDINTNANLTVVSPRGITVTDIGGPLHFYSVAAEHSALYQFSFSGATDVTVVMAQTESPYWQDPPTAWALNVQHSSISLFGGGFYNWFNGNQTVLVSVNDSTGSLVALNTYGANSIQTGDVVVNNVVPAPFWFCQGYVYLPLSGNDFKASDSTDTKLAYQASL